MIDRHSRVWLSARGWQHVLQSAPPAFHEQMHAWSQAGWPVIARRADADADNDQVCLGLAIPPQPGCGTRPRIALRVGTAEVVQVLPPVALESLTAVIPEAWRAAYALLVQDASASQLSFQAFGSVALQAVTGLAYITPSSDIDLLFYPTRRSQLRQALSLLEKHALHLPIDGEFVFPTGDAVSWKEWSQATRAGNGPRVLAKGRQSVRLATAADLISTLKDM